MIHDTVENFTCIKKYMHIEQLGILCLPTKAQENPKKQKMDSDFGDKKTCKSDISKFFQKK